MVEDSESSEVPESGRRSESPRGGGGPTQLASLVSPRRYHSLAWLAPAPRPSSACVRGGHSRALRRPAVPRAQTGLGAHRCECRRALRARLLTHARQARSARGHTRWRCAHGCAPVARRQRASRRRSGSGEGACSAGASRPPPPGSERACSRRTGAAVRWAWGGGAAGAAAGVCMLHGEYVVPDAATATAATAHGELRRLLTCPRGGHRGPWASWPR